MYNIVFLILINMRIQVRPRGSSIEIKVNDDGTLMYDMKKFKPKDELPITPPHKESLIPTLDEITEKHIHKIHKTKSEVVIDFMYSKDELHICRDDRHVELYSTHCESQSTPPTPYVISIFDFGSEYDGHKL